MTHKIDPLPPAAADDERVIDQLVRVINIAYATGEAGLWIEGTTRTTPTEISAAVRGGEMLAATVDGRIVGCARVRPLDETTADLGYVSTAPEQWGGGVGGKLVRAAEELARSRRVTTMQLELLVPQGWVHPHKDRLRKWYSRLGYRVVRSAPFEEVAAELAPQLATSCEFLVFRKALETAGTSGGQPIGS